MLDHDILFEHQTKRKYLLFSYIAFMSKSPHTCLWFESQALEAAEFYCSLFPGAQIVQKNGFMVLIDLNGQRYMLMNGGPRYQLSHAVSLVVECESQAEIDQYWNALVAGGQEGHCGWLTDRFGLSWQVIPSVLSKLFAEPQKGQRVQAAFGQMKKIDLDVLLNA